MTEKAHSVEEALWQKEMDAANDLYRQHHHPEAEKRFIEALQKAESLGPNHPALATTLNNMGLLYSAMKRYEDAEPAYQRALHLREALFGECHPLVAMTLNNLALMYYTEGNFEKAQSLGKHALEIREKTLPPDHLDIAMSLNNLSLIYYAQGKKTKAQSLCKQALAIREQQLGSEHPLVQTSLKNLERISARSQKKSAPELTAEEAPQVPVNNDAKPVYEQTAEPTDDVMKSTDILEDMAVSPSIKGFKPLGFRTLKVRKALARVRYPQSARKRHAWHHRLMPRRGGKGCVPFAADRLTSY